MKGKSKGHIWNLILLNYLEMNFKIDERSSLNKVKRKLEHMEFESVTIYLLYTIYLNKLIFIWTNSLYRTYGIVSIAWHIESGMLVAIKKFKESDDNEYVRKWTNRT